MKDLKDNVVVVTGAASGMGRELAIQLAQLNCHLALCDINEAELAKTVSLIDNKNIKIKHFSRFECYKETINIFKRKIVFLVRTYIFAITQ